MRKKGSRNDVWDEFGSLESRRNTKLTAELFVLVADLGPANLGHAAELVELSEGVLVRLDGRVKRRKRRTKGSEMSAASGYRTITRAREKRRH